MRRAEDRRDYVGNVDDDDGAVLGRSPMGGFPTRDIVMDAAGELRGIVAVGKCKVRGVAVATYLRGPPHPRVY